MQKFGGGTCKCPGKCYLKPRSEKIVYGFVAQLVEQLTLNQLVRGSNPREATIAYP